MFSLIQTNLKTLHNLIDFLSCRFDLQQHKHAHTRQIFTSSSFLTALLHFYVIITFQLLSSAAFVMAIQVQTSAEDGPDEYLHWNRPASQLSVRVPSILSKKMFINSQDEENMKKRRNIYSYVFIGRHGWFLVLKQMHISQMYTNSSRELTQPITVRLDSKTSIVTTTNHAARCGMAKLFAC